MQFVPYGETGQALRAGAASAREARDNGLIATLDVLDPVGEFGSASLGLVAWEFWPGQEHPGLHRGCVQGTDPALAAGKPQQQEA